MSLKHIFAAAACAATVLACGPATAADPVTYTVGTGATYRPFEFQAPNKEIVGFDIDLVKAIAKEQGFNVEFINTLFGVIFESVRNGDRDMIISGITITPQRKEAVDFSYPYFAAHQLILTQKNLTVKTVADLKGKNVAVVANSAGDIACSKVFGKASSNIKRFDNTPLVLEELSAGGVDAAVGDKVELEAICVVDGETVEADPAKAAATKVVATVIEQFKGEKVLVFKFKKRKNYKKLRGHRQQLTRVEINSVGTAVAE